MPLHLRRAGTSGPQVAQVWRVMLYVRRPVEGGTTSRDRRWRQVEIF
jgi:hypothetical protein